MAQRVLHFEFVIVIAMLVSLLTDLLTLPDMEGGQIVYGTGFLVLVLLKVHYEGSRSVLLIELLAHTLLMLSKYYNHGNYLLLSLVVVSLIVCVIMIVKMPVFQLPDGTGLYAVGFTEFNIENDRVSVYYPVDRTRDNLKLPRYIRHIRGRSYIDELYENMKPAFKWPPPLWLIRLIMGSLYKTYIDVYLRAPITSAIEEFTPIVFSNGLGGLRDHYSFFHREMASHGFIVFARQYDEPFSVLTPEEQRKVMSDPKSSSMMDKIKSRRNEQLNVRVLKTIALIDRIKDSTFRAELFKRPITVSNEVIGAGHSFGAATVFQTAVQDRRLNGGIIMYDPYFLPLPESSLAYDLGVPVLCINSETFQHKSFTLSKERSPTIFGAQRQQLCVEFINSDHVSFTDLTYLIPGEMTASTEIRSTRYVELIITATLKLSLLFVQNRQQHPKKRVWPLFQKCAGKAILNVQYA